MEKEEEGGEVVDLRLQSEAGEKLNGERIVWAAGGGNVTEDRFATRDGDRAALWLGLISRVSPHFFVPCE